MSDAATGDPRDRAVDALMALAAERPWAEIGLADIAQRAGLSLGALRSAFPSKGAILGAFSRRLDLAALADDGADLAGEPPRERVFDVLMRRFEAMRPYRTAIASIRSGVMGEPLTVAALNTATVNSMQWMLASAGVSAEGPLGAVKAQGLALLYVRAMDTFLKDDDPGLARTMAALDKELRGAEPFVRGLADIRTMVSGFASVLRPRRPAQEPKPDDPIAGSDLTAPL